MALTLTKHLECFDGADWRPIIWFSNRKDSAYESSFDNKELLIEHGKIFNNAFEEFTALVEGTELDGLGLPDDLSDYIKDKIQSRPGTLCGLSYYYLNELKGLIDHEERILFGELKNGIEIKLFDEYDNVKKLFDGVVDYQEESVNSGTTIMNVIKTTIYTVEQLKYIANIVSKFVYEIHGFVDDDKIRVIYYYD